MTLTLDTTQIASIVTYMTHHAHYTQHGYQDDFDRAWGSDTDLMAELTDSIRTAQALDARLVAGDCTHALPEEDVTGSGPSPAEDV